MNKQILFLLLILLIVIININFKNETSESFISQKSKASFSKKDIKGTAGPLKQTFKIFNSQLLLGTKNKGRSGEDINNEVQLYLGGKINYGSNNGRKGHQTYKLKIDSYSKNVYPIYCIDEGNKKPDFYVFNDSKKTSSLLNCNVKVKNNLTTYGRLSVRDNINIKNLSIKSNKLFTDTNTNINNDMIDYFNITKNLFHLNQLEIKNNLNSMGNIKTNKVETDICEINGHFSYNNQNINDYFFPIGSIVAYKNIMGIPDGWFICDGTKGTPDLRDRFLVGIDDKKIKKNEYGGEELITLTIDNLPKHKHDINNGGQHSHPYKDIYNSSSLTKEQASYIDKIIKGLGFYPEKSKFRLNNVKKINNKIKAFLQAQEITYQYPYNIYRTILEYFCPMVDNIIDSSNRGNIPRLYTSMHDLLMILDNHNNYKKYIKKYIYGKVANDFVQNTFYCRKSNTENCSTHEYQKNVNYMGNTPDSMPNIDKSDYMKNHKTLPINIEVIKQEFELLFSNKSLFRTQTEFESWNNSNTEQRKNLKFSKYMGKDGKYDPKAWKDNAKKVKDEFYQMLKDLKNNLEYFRDNIYGMTESRIRENKTISSFFSEFYKLVYGNMKLDREDLRYTGFLNDSDAANLNDFDSDGYMGIRSYLIVLNNIEQRLNEYKNTNKSLLDSQDLDSVNDEIKIINLNKKLLNMVKENSDIYKLSLNMNNQKDLNDAISKYQQMYQVSEKINFLINQTKDDSFIKKTYKYKLSDLNEEYTFWQKQSIEEGSTFPTSLTIKGNFVYFQTKLKECYKVLLLTQKKIKNIDKYGNINQTITDNNCNETGNYYGSSVGTNSEANGYQKDRITLTEGKHSHNMEYVGNGMPHSNMPPYHSLYYIMKLI